MQVCPNCGASYEAADFRDNYFCPHCKTITPCDPGLDHFAALGFTPPACDRPELKSRYLELNRLLHPDRYTTAPEPHRQASLVNVSKVNDAYRCLDDTVSRARYWLELCGKPLGSDGDGLKPALASELFELQELASRLTSGADDGEAKRSAEAAVRSLQERIGEAESVVEEALSQWPHGDDDAVAGLSGRLAEIAYLNTAVRNLKGAMEDGCRRSVA